MAGCPPLLAPETAACGGGACDGFGHCTCGDGMLAAGDFYPAGLACFDRTAIVVLWSLSAFTSALALVYIAFFIAMIQTSVERKFGRTALGAGAFGWGILTFSLSVVRAVHPEWTLGSDPLSSVLFSGAYIAFWAFICAVILRVVVLAKRVQKFQADGVKSVLVQRANWIYVLILFVMCVCLAPVVMLGVDQSLSALTALKAVFFWGNAFCVLCCGGFSLRFILVPLCESFKAHVADRAAVPGAVESTAQMSVVVGKMDRFARFIEIDSVASFLTMALFGSWPVLLRASAYLMPLLMVIGAVTILTCVNLFWPVSKPSSTTGSVVVVADIGSAVSASVPSPL